MEKVFATAFTKDMRHFRFGRKISRVLKRLVLLIACFPIHALPVLAEVVGVTVTSRTPVAEGRTFNAAGSYEQLTGRIEFALDPDDPHNRGIVDLVHAPRDADGRVHFSSDLYVVRPTDPRKGNGVLLFEVANRGGKGGMLNAFNRGATNDPTSAAGAGDGFLMRDGYTIVWIGWEFDVPVTALRLSAPPVALSAGEAVEPLSVDLIVNERLTEAFIIDEPLRPPVVYPTADVNSQTDRLTVRQRFWDKEVVIPRERWRFVSDASSGIPKVHLDGGFAPGVLYRVTYRPTGVVVAGAGLAAIRDAAAAFHYRADLPIHGESAYVFGNSQTGRFLREFLYSGFNVDEHDRRVFDAMWIHIAGAARGSFNKRFATPSHGDPFEPTRFPFTDAEERDTDGTRGGLQSRYRPDQRPKIFYTNTPVEYWGGGRAAALTHVSVDGTTDLPLPQNVRLYMLAGAQHLPFPFPPDRRAVPGANGRNDGQELPNTTPQRDILRALLRALHAWASAGVSPPPSLYPRLRDRTLVSIQQVNFPALPGVPDPRRIVGPARIKDGTVTPLPHLVPQVDRDGNDVAGIRDPEVAVPLATTTGWNFRAPRVGNPEDIYQVLGSYIPFAPTRASRSAGDPRRSIEERYKGVEDYLQRIRSASRDLIRRRYLLEEDLSAVLDRARAHWEFATGGRTEAPPAVRP
jgi:hypothetical protein